MKVSLREHGGIAAATRLGRPAKILDDSLLDAAAATELARLVAAAKAAQSSASTPRPDEMSYSITVEEDDGTTSTLRASDMSMGPEFDALLSWVQAKLE
jgi:predicted nicotinamide N-methyase